MRGKSISRRTLLGATLGLAALPIVSGCQAIASVASNPAVRGWLGELSATVGANIVTDLSKEGMDETARAWSNGVGKLYAKWFPDRYSSDTACIFTRAYRSDTSPVFLLVATVASAAECGTAPDDPLNDGCGVVINKGKDGLHLPSWSWQTLVMFAREMTRDKRNADLEQMKKLLSVALAPTSSKVKRDTSWASAVAYVSYMTHLGPVDIAKVENPDHTFRGLVKVSGFPDDVGSPTVWDFPLPTAAAM